MHQPLPRFQRDFLRLQATTRPSHHQHQILRPKEKQQEQKKKLRQTALPSRAFRALSSQSCQSQPKQYACRQSHTTNRPNKNVGCGGRLTDMCKGVANHVTCTKCLLICIRTMPPFADAFARASSELEFLYRRGQRLECYYRLRPTVNSPCLPLTSPARRLPFPMRGSRLRCVRCSQCRLTVHGPLWRGRVWNLVQTSRR